MSEASDIYTGPGWGIGGPTGYQGRSTSRPPPAGGLVVLLS